MYDHRRPERRSAEEIQEKGAKIGDLLGLKRVPLFKMAWKEPRLDLPEGGECYPLIDVLERLAELVNIPVRDRELKGPEFKPDAESKKKPGRPPKAKEK